MSTSYYLLCDAHREVVKANYHRARGLLGPSDERRLHAFIYRHSGCALRVCNEHEDEPWDYSDDWWVAPDESGEVPIAEPVTSPAPEGHEPVIRRIDARPGDVILLKGGERYEVVRAEKRRGVPGFIVRRPEEA